MVVIVDYKLGNLGSIYNMLRRLGASVVISDKSDEIRQAEKIILPGVGSFDGGMENLNRSGLRPLLEELVLEKRVPTLGVCLGMQLLTRGSEEGTEPGLGWVSGRTVAFEKPANNPAIKIPHMGWNSIAVKRPDPILTGLTQARFYFVHAYHVKCDDPSNVLAHTEHGEQFVSVYRYGNIWGTQFHPEKSHRFGMKLLANFVEMN